MTLNAVSNVRLLEKDFAIDHLSKIYVENTSRCNLKCKMCLLNTLQEGTGLMPLALFEELLDQLGAFPQMPTIHFAGYGEPTSHPDFVAMLRAAKAAGARIGITTNGTLLTAELARELVALQIDHLVVSIDGVQPEHYQDIRLGSHLEDVIANMMTLRRAKLRGVGHHSLPKVGIAFVAMKRNIADLALLPHLAARIGADEIIVSNVIPHTREMEGEILYEQALQKRLMPRATISLPRMDVTLETGAVLQQLSTSHMSLAVLDAQLTERTNYCRFIEEGYSVVRWDGAVSPCLAFMHEHVEYQKGYPRKVHHYAVGNIREQRFAELWQSEEYRRFRANVHEFHYSPCTTCIHCDMFADGLDDCMHDHPSPVCGGCLWAQGLVQCP